MKKPAKKPAAKRRKSKRVEVVWMSKSALSHELGVSRVTLDAYLSRTEPPPPLPNKTREYNVEEVAAYIGGIKNEAGKVKGFAWYKTEKVRLECERIAHELATARGVYVKMANVIASLAPLITELDAMLEQQFVQVLPARCKGKSSVEIAELAREIKDRVTERFRSGVKDIA